MKLAKSLVTSVAFAALALAAAPLLPSGTALTPAMAATSVSFNLFFDGLSRHGDWVRLDGRYVFVPARRDRGWRPYTLGRWVYTDDFGWTWASDEPFGWATYHYGRWGFSSDIGWYWVPGTRWAPAWVSWRRSHDHVVWAPLPPTAGDGISVSITIGSIPDYYWIAVPTVHFLDADFRLRIVYNDRDRRRIIQNTREAGTVKIRNNIVVNTAIDIKDIESETGKKAKRAKVRRTDDPRQAKATENEVQVFDGTIAPNRDEKPKKVSNIEEVKKNRPRADRNAEAEPQNDAAETNAGGNSAEEQPPAKARKKVEQDAEPPVDAPAKKAKKNVQTTVDQQPKADKKLKKKDAQKNADQKPANRKQVEGKPKKPAKKNAGCDPKKDPDCAAM